MDDNRVRVVGDDEATLDDGEFGAPRAVDDRGRDVPMRSWAELDSGVGPEDKGEVPLRTWKDLEVSREKSEKARMLKIGKEASREDVGTERLAEVGEEVLEELEAEGVVEVCGKVVCEEGAAEVCAEVRGKSWMDLSYETELGRCGLLGLGTELEDGAAVDAGLDLESEEYAGEAREWEEDYSERQSGPSALELEEVYEEKDVALDAGYCSGDAREYGENCAERGSGQAILNLEEVVESEEGRYAPVPETVTPSEFSRTRQAVRTGLAVPEAPSNVAKASYSNLSLSSAVTESTALLTPPAVRYAELDVVEYVSSELDLAAGDVEESLRKLRSLRSGGSVELVVLGRRASDEEAPNVDVTAEEAYEAVQSLVRDSTIGLAGVEAALRERSQATNCRRRAFVYTGTTVSAVAVAAWCVAELMLGAPLV